VTAFTHIVRRLRSERGQALVEFALIAPLFFVLLFGMLDFGKAFNYWNVEQQMANEGARLAAVNATGPWTCPDGTSAASLPDYIKCQAVTGELKNGGTFWLPNPAKVCVAPAAGASNPPVPGDPISVTVSAAYNWLPLVAQRVGATQTTITGSATMRLEAPQLDGMGCTTP
jgi:Flp pilus assembly protein TadG